MEFLVLEERILMVRLAMEGWWLSKEKELVIHQRGKQMEQTIPLTPIRLTGKPGGVGHLTCIGDL